MTANRVKTLLDSNHIPYATLKHRDVYRAAHVASATHLPPKEIAKTVMIKVDGQLAMAVLPASRDVDLEVLKASLDADHVRLAGEAEFRNKFPDCDTGAMPPFGNLYAMEVFVDQSLADDQHIAFEAGTHNQAIRLTYADFARLVRPQVLSFSTPHRLSTAFS